MQHNYHDSAHSYTAFQTINYLKQQKIDLKNHRLYSPDLAPNEIFLFQFIKNKMRGHQFRSPNEEMEIVKASCHNVFLIQISVLKNNLLELLALPPMFSSM